MKPFTASCPYTKHPHLLFYSLLLRQVEIHEIEERKNLHINDLMENHENAFKQIKEYYNDITDDNLKLIRSLRDQVRSSDLTRPG